MDNAGKTAGVAAEFHIPILYYEMLYAKYPNLSCGNSCLGSSRDRAIRIDITRVG